MRNGSNGRDAVNWTLRNGGGFLRTAMAVIAAVYVWSRWIERSEATGIGITQHLGRVETDYKRGDAEIIGLIQAHLDKYQKHLEWSDNRTQDYTDFKAATVVRLEYIKQALDRIERRMDSGP